MFLQRANSIRSVFENQERQHNESSNKKPHYKLIKELNFGHYLI